MLRNLIDDAIAIHDLAITDSNRGRAIRVLDWLKKNCLNQVTDR